MQVFFPCLCWPGILYHWYNDGSGKNISTSSVRKVSVWFMFHPCTFAILPSTSVLETSSTSVSKIVYTPSSVHGFSASYVTLRNKAEIQLAIGLLRRYSPVVEYFTLQSLLQEITSPVHGFSASYVALRNKAELSPVVEYFTLESLLQEIIQQWFNFFVLLGDEMRVRLDSNSLHCCMFSRPLSLLQEIIQHIVLIVRFFALEVSRLSLL